MPREKIVRAQLNMFKSVATTCSLETARKAQEIMGSMVAYSHSGKVRFTPCFLNGLESTWVLPMDEKRKGAVLYLHGGGFACGDAQYARGFGSVLADECSIRVLCVTYRLAPEYPYPAALEDCLAAYRYLLQAGYRPESILLCGESAGGGLVYSLCLRLKQLGLPLPGGLLAISPWCDLTQSADSYRRNAKKDPSMTKERLDFFASLYAKDLQDPLVSPLLGDFEGLPPSLIFAGGDEVMLDDSAMLDEKLRQSGCQSRLVVKEGLWHAYVLHGLKEHRKEDMATINGFIDRLMPGKRKLRWMKLDNAAKIYPAARRRNWNNVFRLSVTLKEDVDPVVLQSALDVTIRRFPSIAVRLRRGLFWYYLEEIKNAPDVKMDKHYPLYRMPFDDIRTCAFRVLYYNKRIAVEFFHALTDGTGGLVFLKSLVCEYLMQKHAVFVPSKQGVLDRLEPPAKDELEDAFVRYAGQSTTGRKDTRAFRIRDTLEEDGFLHVTTGAMSVKQLKEKAAQYGISLTVFLSAVLIESLLLYQKEIARGKNRYRPVKVQIPVNLRKMFPSRTLRNFVYFFCLGIDPSLGDYSFEEIVKLLHHQMGLEYNEKLLRSRFTTNVRTEQNVFLKVIPLFLKNLAMKAVYRAVGEKTATLCLSNLGVLELPEEAAPFVDHADFLLTCQADSPYNCSAVTYRNTLRFSIVRNTVAPRLEQIFFSSLVKRKISVKIESNSKEE